MNIYYQLTLLLILTGIASQTVAGSLQYSFVSAGYSQFSSDIDGLSEAPEGNGVSIDVSFAVRPYIALTAGYRNDSGSVTISDTKVEADIESTSLGILIHLPINDAADFILSTSFINGEADVDKNGAFYAIADADGGQTDLGFRAKVYDTLELNSFVYKTTIEDDSRLGISFGAAWYIVKTVSADLEYFIDSDYESLAIGVTKYF